MHDSRQKADSLMQSAINNIKEQDILHRGFLKPLEIALKNHKTQHDDPSFKPGALARGLKIAVRQDYTSDKRILNDVTIVDPQRTSLADLKLNNQDNILSLMKKREGIKLAICVCMYSQDKKMLKSTLSGVANNIANLVAYQNMDPDQIGVFVMMDGIEKVDSSVIDYFQELERSSNINLGDNIVPALTMEEIAARAMTMDEEQINQLQIKNVNNYLFDVAELQERNNLRFEQVRKDYDEIKELLKEIKKLKASKPLFDDLPAKLKPFFYEQAKEELKRDYGMTDENIKFQERDPNNKQLLNKRLYNEYALNIVKAGPVVMKALQDGERFCNNYISTREDLAYLACFRKKIPFSFEVLQKTQPQGNRQNQYADQIEEDNKYTVMNLFMCVKYKNAGKLSSHNWFFNGFCQQLRPEFAVLLDVGLRPYDEALVKMYKYLSANVRTGQKGGVGGVCGYMSLKIEKVQGEQQIKDEEIDFLTSIVNKFTDIQRTQQVEYHFAHLMDKGFQASFGFIHVLPGAFSAYNMKAIIDYDRVEDDQLLKSYFKSIDQKLASRKVVKSEMSIGDALMRTLLPDFINSCFINIDPESDEAMLYEENVYLAEDRILCMGIHKKGYDMSYLPDAYAEVDPIKTVHGLLGQRKRWINGSYFAFEKVKKQLKEHENTNGCEIFLNLQIFYLSLMNSLSYFSPAFFLFTVHIAMDAFRSDVLTKVLNGVVTSPETSQFYNAFVYTMDFIYVLLIMTIVFMSLHLTNRHKRFVPYIYGVSTLFGLFMVCVFLVLVVDIFRGLINYDDSFLQQTLKQNVPGGTTIINIMRWLLVGSVLIYIVPISIYILLFGRLNILCEIILGGFSFLFFGPTYLNILNIYSLCRIDDISWGTKGLDSGSNKNANLKDSWKLIKFVHVIKYVSWNVILGATLLTLGSSYISRFFVTIVMVILIGVSMSVKVLLSCIYMLLYWCKYSKKLGQPRVTPDSQIKKVVEHYSSSILDEVKQHLQGVKEEYIKHPNNGTSFIQASRRGNQVKSSFKKHQDLQKGRSNIQRTNGPKKNQRLGDLHIIQEERQSIGINSGGKVSLPQKSSDTSKKISEKQVSNDISLKSNSSGNDLLLGLPNPPNQFMQAESPTKMNQSNQVNEFNEFRRDTTKLNADKFKKSSKK